MPVIGFFKDLFSSLAGLINFVATPLGQQLDITIEPFASMSIVGLFGVGLVGTLGVFLTIKLIRLFIGG